jgi:hypothetical protein
MISWLLAPARLTGCAWSAGKCANWIGAPARDSGLIASQPPGPLPRLPWFQLDEVGASSECVRRAGHWFDGHGGSASLGPRHLVCGIDHQVAVGIIDPQVEGPAAVRVLQSGDCTTVAAANQAAEGGVQLGRPDPAGAGEVLRRRCNWDHELPARPTVWLEVMKTIRAGIQRTMAANRIRPTVTMAQKASGRATPDQPEKCVEYKDSLVRAIWLKRSYVGVQHRHR